MIYDCLDFRLTKVGVCRQESGSFLPANSHFPACKLRVSSDLFDFVKIFDILISP